MSFPEAPLALIVIDPGRPEPLYRQIYDAIRSQILDGKLRPGRKLAPSRRLAERLGVSRSTTVLAYDMLLAEGYVEGRAGSGTFVSPRLPEHLLPTPPAPAPAVERDPPPRIARRTRRVAESQEIWSPTPVRPFRMGLPALDVFPHAAWARIATRLLRAPGELEWDYGEPAGLPELREAIAEHLLLQRGVECSPEQVLVTSGSQQGLDLCARVLLDPGERCWIEDPGYLGARAALTSAGVELAAVPVDDEGLIVRAGRRRAPEARMVYVTPSHQYPLGVTLSLARRLELLEWARRADAWVLEDDYDSEYRYAGRPLTPLKALDSGQRVVYVGTFSKILFPAVRVGYLVVPEGLVDAFLAQRYASTRQSPTLEQAVLARFLREGHLSRHIRRMRVLYRRRQEALLEAAKAEGDGLLEVTHAETGMHVVAWLPESADEQDVVRRAAAGDVTVSPLSGYRIEDSGRPGLLLGFSGFDEGAIRSALGRLAGAVRRSLGKTVGGGQLAG